MIQNSKNFLTDMTSDLQHYSDAYLDVWYSCWTEVVHDSYQYWTELTHYCQSYWNDVMHHCYSYWTEVIDYWMTHVCDAGSEDCNKILRALAKLE